MRTIPPATVSAGPGPGQGPMSLVMLVFVVITDPQPTWAESVLIGSSKAIMITGYFMLYLLYRLLYLLPYNLGNSLYHFSSRCLSAFEHLALDQCVFERGGGIKS